MFKRLVTVVIAGLIILNLCGFVAIVGGVSEFQKVRETVKASYGQALEITKMVLKEQNIKFEKATIDETKARVKGIYPNGETVTIMIYKFSDVESKVEVRVGTSEAGIDDARKIMENIIQHCNQPE